MGSRPRAQSPSSVNKTSQWQLACIFHHTHPPRSAGIKGERMQTHTSFSLKSRDCVPRSYSGSTATMATGRQCDELIGSLEKRHYCWPRPVSWAIRQVPPHQLGWKIGQGLGRDVSHCCSVQWVWITLGSVPWKNTHVESPEGESLQTGT